MRRLARALGWTAAALALVVGLRGLALLAGPAPDSEAWDARTVASLRWLSGDLEATADRMQGLFPEGRVFTLALTGIAWAQVGQADAALAEEALAASRRALALATDSVSRSTFAPAGGLPEGMFFEGWTARLGVEVARLARAEGAEADTSALAASCRRLNGVLSGGAPFPDSYPGAAWPADAVVGAAALAGCGDLLGGPFRGTAEGWLARAVAEADPATGLLPHAEGSTAIRGSSTALMLPFLAEIDPAVARAMRPAFVDAFATRLLGVLPAVREYPRGVSGPGDVDSGPVVFGVSAPASVVGIAASRATGDPERARALRASTEAVGAPVEWGGRRRYGLGALPVGDAFLAWASSVPLAEASAPPLRWRGRWAAASVALLLAGGLGGLALRRAR